MIRTLLALLTAVFLAGPVLAQRQPPRETPHYRLCYLLAFRNQLDQRLRALEAQGRQPLQQQTDPAILAVLQQMAATQQQILALLQQMGAKQVQPATPAAPQAQQSAPILYQLPPNPYIQQVIPIQPPQQTIPITPPQQTLPIQPPQQQLQIQAPQQTMPILPPGQHLLIGPPAQQTLPAAPPQSQQTLPTAPPQTVRPVTPASPTAPAPQQTMPLLPAAPQQTLPGTTGPTGYQQYSRWSWRPARKPATVYATTGR